jgi:Domain of unknown function (DUF4375)
MRSHPRALPAALLFAALTLPACREKPPAAPPPPAPAPPPAALPAVEPAPAVELSDGDAYFAVIEPYMDRLSIYDPPAKFAAAYADAPEKVRNLLTAHWAVAEVSNGGFLQLFSSAAGVLAPEAVAGLAALGLPENAAILTEAMAILGTRYVREHNARHKLVQALKRKNKSENPFADLDERFFTQLKRRPGGFDAVAAAYARSAS